MAARARDKKKKLRKMKGKGSKPNKAGSKTHSTRRSAPAAKPAKRDRVKTPRLPVNKAQGDGDSGSDYDESDYIEPLDHGDID